MKFVFFLSALLGFALIPHAKAEPRRYRWAPKLGLVPQFVRGALDRILHPHREIHPVVVALAPSRTILLPATGESVHTGAQELGPAKVDGTWTQTVFGPGGEVKFAAGALFDSLPEDEWLARVKKMEAGRADLEAIAASFVPAYAEAGRTFKPELRLRKQREEFEAYWRLEYICAAEEEVQFLEISEQGTLLREGLVPAAAFSGKAMVYPAGPKWSALTEVPLRELSGDGTLTNRFFRITSALGLDVRSPNLTFFFPDSDQRFDLTQVYFTMERSLSWMRDFLGAEVKAPLEVRLHVGEKGVSNAAFYHANTIYLGEGDGITYSGLARDPSVVTHESMHALIESYSALPTQGEGGAFNEGFADFFTALVLKNPRMGDNSFLTGPYRRSLENNFKAYQDFQPGVYRNGSIIGATFWDLRAFLPDEKLAKLAFRTLVRLGAGAQFVDFAPAVRLASEEILSADEQLKIGAALAQRGWE